MCSVVILYRPDHAWPLILGANRDGLQVNVTGPAYRRVAADNTILVQVLNPGPRRDLRTPADLEAVLSGLKPGDVVTFLAYDVPRGPDDKGQAHALSLQVGG